MIKASEGRERERDHKVSLYVCVCANSQVRVLCVFEYVGEGEFALTCRCSYRDTHGKRANGEEGKENCIGSEWFAGNELVTPPALSAH